MPRVPSQKLKLTFLLLALTLFPCCSPHHDAKTLVMLIESSPTNLDPRVGIDAQSERIDNLIFDDLLSRGDDLNVAPTALFAASGNLGGPFTPTSQTYTLRNYGAAPLDWTAAPAQPWVTLSATSGTLAPGQSVNVDVNAAATALEIGAYAQAVTFHNVTSGVDLPRAIALTVNPPRALYFPLDTDPGWSRTGDWAVRLGSSWPIRYRRRTSSTVSCTTGDWPRA